MDFAFICIWKHPHMKFNPMFKRRDPAWHLAVVHCSLTAAAVWLAAAAADMERSWCMGRSVSDLTPSKHRTVSTSSESSPTEQQGGDTRIPWPRWGSLPNAGQEHCESELPKDIYHLFKIAMEHHQFLDRIIIKVAWGYSYEIYWRGKTNVEA